MSATHTPSSIERSVEHSEFEAMLNTDQLTMLMRSTWTWDDRAMRRSLSSLLVRLAAARASRTGPIADVLRWRALADGAEFVRTVLGPKLLAGEDIPQLGPLIDTAIDTPAFLQLAADARDEVGSTTVALSLEQLFSMPYSDESSWAGSVSSAGAEGLAGATRAYGHRLGESPFFAGFAMAWQTLKALDSESGQDLMRGIENGSIQATVAAAEQTGAWDPALVRTKASKVADGWRLSGVKQFAPVADIADVILVIARTIAGPTLFAVDAGAPGVVVTAHLGFDRTRRLFKVALADTPAVLLGTEGGGGSLMFHALDDVVTALAGEQVGLIERSIGAVAAELGESTPELTEMVIAHSAAHALWRKAIDGPPEAAAIAHIGCSEAAVNTAASAARLLGAEASATLQRALSAQAWFGGPASYYERLLERLGV